MAGLILFQGGRTLMAGVTVTLGALVKPTALLALPVFWRPWDWRLPFAVVLTVILAYLPFLSVGSGVFGYLGGYVDEEGFLSGRGINALYLVEHLTGTVSAAATVVYAIVAALVLTTFAIAVAFRKDRSDRTAIASLHWLLVTFLILVSPHYPWYFLVLVPFLAIGSSATGWMLTLTCPLLYASVPGTGWPECETRIAAFMLATLGALAHDLWSMRRKLRHTTVGEAS
jgi:hypothetical protein